MFWSLFGFGTEMIVAHFQRWGIALVFREVSYKFVRYVMASGSRCLRCLMFMPAGLVKLLFVLFEMASCTCIVEVVFCSEKFLESIVYVSVVFVSAIWSDVCKLFIKSKNLVNCWLIYYWKNSFKVLCSI